MAETRINDQFKVFETMTNAELRTELKRRGLTISGNKKDLLAKLRQALIEEHRTDDSIDKSDQNQNLNQSDEINHEEQNDSTKSYLSLSIIASETLVQSDPSSNQINDEPLKESSNNNELSIIESQEIDQKSPSKPFVIRINDDRSHTDQCPLEENLCLSSTDDQLNSKSDSILKQIEPVNQTSNLINEIHSQTIENDENQRIRTEEIHTPTDSNSTLNLKPRTIRIRTDPVQSQTSIKQKQSQMVSSSSATSLIRGGFVRSNQRINLNSNLLKSLILDLSLAPESIVHEEIDGMNHDSHSSQSIKIQSDERLAITSRNLSPQPMTIGDLVDLKKSVSRIVVMDSANKSSSIRITQNHVEKRNSKATSDVDSNVQKDETIIDQLIRVRKAKSIEEPITTVLNIRGLRRPFTSTELKEFLCRYGTISLENLWIDKYKSQCFVIYNTIEEAKRAYRAIDGCRWPSTNQQILDVHFKQQQDFEFCKSHDRDPDERITYSPKPVKEKKTETSKNKSQEKPTSGFVISEDEPEIDDKTSERSLDDYFRKTTVKPSIYWLPLSEEEAIDRQSRKKQRHEIEFEESVTMNSYDRRRLSTSDQIVEESDSYSHNYSKSSRDKRKRRSPVTRYERKRH